MQIKTNSPPLYCGYRRRKLLKTSAKKKKGKKKTCMALYLYLEKMTITCTLCLRPGIPLLSFSLHFSLSVTRGLSHKFIHFTRSQFITYFMVSLHGTYKIVNERKYKQHEFKKTVLGSGGRIKLGDKSSNVM